MRSVSAKITSSLPFLVCCIAAISGITWAGYKRDCGYEPFLTSPRKAKFAFDNRYRFRGVSWDGYVVRVNLNEDPDPIQ